MTWLTTSELAGLPGMPRCQKRTREKLVRLGVPSRPRAGRDGGGGMEYDCAALPAETRAALATRQISTAAVTVLASVPTPAVQQPPAEVAPAAARTTSRPASLDDQAVADARVILIHQVQDLAHLHGIKKACAILALQLASGQASSSLVETARTANRRARKGSSGISARSLERWLATHRDGGWTALLPAQPAVDLPTPATLDDDVAQVLAMYHSKDARFRKLSGAAKEVTKRLGRDIDSWTALYQRARRAVAKLGTSHVANTALIKSRHSGAQRDAKLPFKRRDTSVLNFNDVWLIDGHTFKAKVRHPDHGAPFAPELTVTIDAATRYITGWSVAYSENVIAVGDALRHGIGNCGVPAILYGDNGAGETAKPMDCPIDGFCARLGIEHKTGLPGKPQGHGLIERSWQTHAINAARQFQSYQGKDVDGGTFRKVASALAKEQRALRRAEAVGEVIQLSPKAPTWQQFIDVVISTINEYNTTHRHRSLPKNADGKRMTPAEARAVMTRPDDIVLVDPATLRSLFMPAVLRTARRGEVQFFNQTYSAPELMRRDVDGHQVSVRYDIHDPSQVQVFTLDGQFVCDAQWAANRMDYMPKPVIQMAKEKRVAASVKLRQAQIDLISRELQPSVPTELLLPEPGLPCVIDVSQSITQALGEQSPAQHLVTDAVPMQASAQDTRRLVFDTQGERYEWLMRHRNAWMDQDQEWVNRYVQSDDYRDLADYYEGRGLAWGAGGGDELPRFKGAW